MVNVEVNCADTKHAHGGATSTDRATTQPVRCRPVGLLARASAPASEGNVGAAVVASLRGVVVHVGAVPNAHLLEGDAVVEADVSNAHPLQKTRPTTRVQYVAPRGGIHRRPPARTLQS